MSCRCSSAGRRSRSLPDTSVSCAPTLTPMVTTPPLHDPAWWAGDPYPAFAELRAEDPIHRYEGEAGELWMITRHADIPTIARDPATFSSQQGVLLTDLTRPSLATG